MPLILLNPGAVNDEMRLQASNSCKQNNPTRRPLTKVKAFKRRKGSADSKPCKTRKIPQRVLEDPLLHEAVADDDDDPHDEHTQGDPIEVALCDTGGACARRNASAEHVGDATALALMHEHSEGEQDARQDDEHEEGDLQSGHSVPDSSVESLGVKLNR